MDRKTRIRMVLRPGFEPGSSARKAEILNQTILGRKGATSLLLPEPKPEHQPHKPYIRFNFSPSKMISSPKKEFHL